MKKKFGRLSFRLPFFTTGRTFDPSDQKRTGAVEDMAKLKLEESEKLFDKLMTKGDTNAPKTRKNRRTGTGA